MYIISVLTQTFKCCRRSGQANGIIGSLDGKLCVDIEQNWVVKINGGQQKFCEMGSDGMTTDRKGNLYLRKG